ncbi:MAG: glycerophosphodiester phosphodiesterase family protein [Alphaproteobacteria bacterium]
MRYRIFISIMIIFIILGINIPKVYAADPKIVAHRGGKANFPENTIYAFKEAIKAGADMIEIDVQLTKDRQVVLYHPADLSTWTEGRGSVDEYNYDDIKMLNAAYNFDPASNKKYPMRKYKLQIPLLYEILTELPETKIIVDLKSLPAKDLIDAVIKVVDKIKAWNRLIFYSTNSDHLDYLKYLKPDAIVFESRTKTRERLLKFRNEGSCCCKDFLTKHIGFELDREMLVEESFALGKDKNIVHFRLWDDDAINCIQETKGKDTKIFLFGINNVKNYNIAKKLGVYAVFTDNPLELIDK